MLQPNTDNPAITTNHTFPDGYRVLGNEDYEATPPRPAPMTAALSRISRWPPFKIGVQAAGGQNEIESALYTGDVLLGLWNDVDNDDPETIAKHLKIVIGGSTNEQVVVWSPFADANIAFEVKHIEGIANQAAYGELVVYRGLLRESSDLFTEDGERKSKLPDDYPPMDRDHDGGDA